jgi:beta-N-acetylhexosaminidase
LDPVLPSTFSENTVKLLKNDLAFKGLLLTDDLEMGALDGIFLPGDSAVKAIDCGHDLALICRSRENVAYASERLQKAIRDSELGPKRLRQASLRLSKALKFL